MRSRIKYCVPLFVVSPYLCDVLDIVTRIVPGLFNARTKTDSAIDCPNPLQKTPYRALTLQTAPADRDTAGR